MPKGPRQRPEEQRAGSIRPWVLVLALLVIIAFAPVLGAGYLRLDDYDNILVNSDIQDFSFSGLGRLWTGSRLGFYIPLTYSLWWLYAGMVGMLGKLGQNASFFHALNLALHIVNAALVFALCRTLLRLSNESRPALGRFRATAIPFLATLAFAIHPAQVETVAWITELKGLAAGCFGLLGVWTYYARPSKKVATAGLFLAAMLCKPSAIVFPGILLVVDRILLGKSVKDSARWPLTCWALLLPFVLVTKYLQPNLDMEFVPGFVGRIIVAVDAFAFYGRKLLVPFDLALDYGRSPYRVLHQVPGWQTVLSALLSLAALAVVVYSWVRPHRPDGKTTGWGAFVRCGWAVSCLALLPVLGMVPFAFQDFTTTADHYLYVPLLGASFVVMGVLLRLEARTLPLAVSTVVGVVFATSTLIQASTWRSTETVFTRTLAVNPQSYLAHYSIGTDLLEAGKTDEAILRFKKCLAIRPTYLSAQVAIGIVWMQQRKYQETIDYYGSVLGPSPSTAGKRSAFVAMMHNTFGSALCAVGREGEGAVEFGKAVELDPASVTAHMNLGRVALKDGRYADAAKHYRTALALRPGSREIERLLAAAKARIR